MIVAEALPRSGFFQKPGDPVLTGGFRHGKNSDMRNSKPASVQPTCGARVRQSARKIQTLAQYNLLTLRTPCPAPHAKIFDSFGRAGGTPSRGVVASTRPRP